MRSHVAHLTPMRLVQLSQKSVEMSSAFEFGNEALRHAVHLCLKHGDARPLISQLHMHRGLAERIDARYENYLAAKANDPFYPAPTRQEALKLKGPIEVGTINRSGDKIGLLLEEFCLNLASFGRPGTGKSVLKSMMIDAILELKTCKVLVLDPKSDHLHLARKHEIAVISFEDMWFNLWQPPEGFDPYLYIAAASRIFIESNVLQDIGLRVIEKALRICFDNMKYIDGQAIWPTNEDIFNAVNNVFSSMQGGGQWSDFRVKLRLRLQSLIDQSQTFNCPFGFPIEFFLNNSIIITGTSKNPDYLVRLVLLGIMMKLHLHALSKGLRSQGLRLLFVLDEAYTFLDSEMDSNPYIRNDIMKLLLRQNREFGYGVWASAQEPGSLTRTLRDNAAHVLTFPLHAGSLEEAKKIMNLSNDEANHLNKLPGAFTGIIRTPRADRPLIFKVENPVFRDKHMSQEEIEEINRPLIGSIVSDLKDRNERAIAYKLRFTSRLGSQQKKQARTIKISEHAEIVVDTLQRLPFLPHSLLLGKIGLSQKDFTSTIDHLKSAGLIHEVVCVTARTGKKSRFYPLSDQNNPQPKIPARLFPHTFYTHLIARSLRSTGAQPILEYSREGYLGRIDIGVNSESGLIAYEITLSRDNLLQNIEKCIDMGAKEITIVCESSKDLNAAETLIQSKHPEFASRVGFSLVKDFIKSGLVEEMSNE